MKKYNVRIYVHTFVDMEVEANSKEEAIEIAENTDFDCNDQILENMVIADDTDAEEIKD